MSQQIIRNGCDSESRSKLNAIEEKHQGGPNGIAAQNASYVGARFFCDPGETEDDPDSDDCFKDDKGHGINKLVSRSEDIKFKGAYVYFQTGSFHQGPPASLYGTGIRNEPSPRTLLAT